MDLIFSTSNKYQEQPKNQKPISTRSSNSGAAAMVVDSIGMRGPGREFLRSISSVTTSPVSHLPGGGTEEKLAAVSMPKMSKKELKLAQNQLNKLTQINIHLHGKQGWGKGDQRCAGRTKLIWTFQLLGFRFNRRLLQLIFPFPSTALFSAVEHGHLEKARTILESSDVNVNSVNSDGLSPLDVALLSNNRPMTKMLQQRGAKEAFQCEYRWEKRNGTT